MAARQLPLHSISFGKMVPLERKTSSLVTKNFNVPCPIQCMALSDVSSHTQTVRRSANFQPSIWHYDYIQSLSSEYKEEKYTKQSRVLKEEIRVMLCQVEDHAEQLEMIDVLQRLGVAYHFTNEIRSILENVHSNMDMLKRKNNLYATALAFRLLRQHGYNLSTDVFGGFQDEMGNFKKCLSVDVEGLLSLYEASFHSVEDELILDEARDFTSKFLEEYVEKNRGNGTSLLISHALEFPLHWRVPRLEALWFINFLEERRQNEKHALLQFAKLDFNMVQSIYQEELKYTSRWWKGTGLVEELSFVRNRFVENFYWAVGFNFKPDLGNFRKELTKVISLITTIDDIYDVHGTLEELELFTEAIDRWDLNAMDGLPHYMKICFLALYNSVNEIAYATLKENRYNIIPYLKKAWADLCKSYLVEAKWYYSGYTPRLQEYIENAWITISGPVVLVHAYFLIPRPLGKEDLVFLEEYPNIIRLSAIIFRLANDLGTCKREVDTGDVTKSIQCHMEETGASEADSREYIKGMIRTTWKKMNEEARNSSFSQSFIDTAIDVARMSLCFYQYGDGYTLPDHDIKSCMLSLIMQPIPVTIKEKYAEASSWWVCDCADPDGGWQWSKFNSFLSNEAVDAIAKVMPPSEGAGTDKVVWNLSSTGIFSIKTAYISLSRQFDYDDSRNWCLAWDWEGPQRIRAFLWLLMGENLLSNDQRVRRHLGEDATCMRWQADVEDCNHIFRECSWACQIWQLCCHGLVLNGFWEGDFVSWIERNLNRKKENKDWRRLFGVVCWLIWKERNNGVFNDEWETPIEVVRHAMMFMHNVLVAEKMFCKAGLMVDSRSVRKPHWEAPPTTWIKLNSDGACSVKGTRLSCGGVIRSCNGDWIAGFSKGLGCGNILMAKLWGILIGLEWTWVKGYQRVMVETDSMDACELITQGCVDSHPCHLLMLRIREMLEKSWMVRVDHVNRECNRVADWLARQASQVDWSIVWLSEPPEGCLDLLLEDCRANCAQGSR
ncbi:myrcene synthase, chloroplastic-like [Gastrolobium bilobum]|uniref:myrcene synthase, chloroplastic-like n=1 Tax=Gastrolobium bilobum TaxID=150636 RepID=UPI002AB1993C|nr:myrcene synthase, chloroplastic-like [Gastrolobium bilobum]